jgi:hypothetical protein
MGHVQIICFDKAGLFTIVILTIYSQIFDMSSIGRRSGGLSFGNEIVETK